MRFEDYAKLNERAEAAGIGDDTALIHLLHLLQAQEVAKRSFKKYMREMHEWEKNVAREAECRIAAAEKAREE